MNSPTLQLTCDPRSATLPEHVQKCRECVRHGVMLRPVSAPAASTGAFHGLLTDTLLCFALAYVIYDGPDLSAKCHLV